MAAESQRTIVIDNVAPWVTDATIRCGLSQLGVVESVDIVKDPLFDANRAIVQMGSIADAKNVLYQAASSFLILGNVPRSINARPLRLPPAQPPKLEPRLLRKGDRDFDAFFKRKSLLLRHESQRSILRQHQKEEEERLHEQQQKNVKEHFENFETLLKLKRLYERAAKEPQGAIGRAAAKEPQGAL